MDASASSGDPLVKGEQSSALANLLLTLWSHGQLSASLIQQLAHMASPEALDCLVNLLSVFDAADMVLTEMEFDQATNLAKRFFDVYDWLHRWAARVDRKLFHITMKFHTGHHLVHDSQHLNRKASWNFRSEDFVGKISRLGGSVAMGVKSTKLSSKIATGPCYTCS